MSPPTDDRPEKAIRSDSVSSAFDISPAEATALERSVRANLSPEQLKVVADTWLDAQRQQVEYVEAQTRLINAQAGRVEEDTREKRLINEEIEDRRPFSRAGVRLAFAAGTLMLLGGLTPLGVSVVRTLQGLQGGFNPLWLLLALAGTALTLGIGSQGLADLLASWVKRKP